MPPTGHALLSASAAHRWLACTAAPRYEAQFRSSGSADASLGTLAHEFCEIYAGFRHCGMPQGECEARLESLRKSPIYTEEMERTALAYADYIARKKAEFQEEPFVALEIRVDLSEWVPQGFGTCDCVMVGGDLLRIVDYKNGVGVVVDAHDNPQLRLYALGALRKFQLINGNIRRVAFSIFQPRVTEDASEDEMTVEELLAWGESIRPVALAAYNGTGEYHPGEHCRFCRGKAVCKARAEMLLSLQQYSHDLIPTVGSTPVEGPEHMLTNTEVAEALRVGALLEQWLKDLKDYALAECLNGGSIPGMKAVAGRSVRVWAKPEDEMVERLKALGLTDEDIYEPVEMRSLAGIEKRLGKKRFAEMLGEQVVKVQGKPTLAPADDKRPAINSAEQDFGGLLL